MKKTAILFLVLIFFIQACAPVGTTSPIQPTSPAQSTVTSLVIPCTILHPTLTPSSAFGDQYQDQGHVFGKSNASVTIILFSDYQCPACAALATTLKQIRLSHQETVRYIYIHTPRADLDKDLLAIQAVEAADLQGKFWELHDLLFEKQAEWISLSPSDFAPWIFSQLEALGIDGDRFKIDLAGSVVAERYAKALSFSAGVPNLKPPLLFINSNSPYTGFADLASLDSVVRMNELSTSQFSNCPTESVNPVKQYLISLHTSLGVVTLNLFPDKAPQAVGNFIFLARKGWYDGMTFYMVKKGDRVYSGDPSATGFGNPGYFFHTEMAENISFDQAGMVAMDNDGVDTNGSRFFITLSANPGLNGQYTIFGQVISGLEILSLLPPRYQTPGKLLPQGLVISSVTVEER